MTNRKLTTAELLIERAIRETTEQETRYTLRQALQLLVGLEDCFRDAREVAKHCQGDQRTPHVGDPLRR